jgi:hypothetical protein
MGENSPNPVTLFGAHFFVFLSNFSTEPEASPRRLKVFGGPACFTFSEIVFWTSQEMKRIIANLSAFVGPIGVARWYIFIQKYQILEGLAIINVGIFHDPL